MLKNKSSEITYPLGHSNKKKRFFKTRLEKRKVSERIQDAVDDLDIEEIGRIQEEVLDTKILKKISYVKK